MRDVDTKCPACKKPGELLAWRNVAIIYACRDCDQAFEIPLTSSSRHLIEPFQTKCPITAKDFIP